MANGDNGNGTVNRGLRLIETLLVAFIIGGITMWGSSQRFDEKLKSIDATLIRIEAASIETGNKLTQHLIDTAGREALREVGEKDTTGRLKELRKDQVRREAKEKR
jgi:hypothetical protein